jgi:lysophospholipid acyltransferase (LPLAT)-like uncharacterized protein
MARSKNTDIKANRTSRLFGYLAAMVMKLWSLTLRYEVNGKRGLQKPVIGEKPVIYALWHNRIFTMPPIWKKTGGMGRSSVVLTSASRDGTTLATAMGIFGLGAIRGSSSRRAVSALIGMKKALAEGFDVCVTPDGPKGPRYIVQPGVIKIAQATDTEIVPIHIRYGSAWRLKSWDRFVIPIPLSLVRVTFDQPHRIPSGISPEDFENARIALEQCLISGSDDC